MQKYIDYAVERAKELLAIDSPTGYTEHVVKRLCHIVSDLGYTPVVTEKGNVFVTVGGEGNPICLAAHVDTLGGMVAEIKSDGRLRLTNIGGMNPNNAEAENVHVHTRDGNIYEGTFQLINASIHVNGNYSKTERTYDTCEVVLDRDVHTASDVAALGIAVGDIVAFEPRTRVTAEGYIKSRFLDDKLSAGILLGLLKYARDNRTSLKRKLYLYFTVHEEVGHGCAYIPASDVRDMLSVDMGCVGAGLTCTERDVSICVKDSHGPYNYDFVTDLVNAAKATNAHYALDVYPRYGSDADVALSSGYDVRHGLIGAGVYASHGYERSHIEGVENTLKLLFGLVF